MKTTQNGTEKLIWEPAAAAAPRGKSVPKIMVWLTLFVSVTYAFYTLKLVSTNYRIYCDEDGVLYNRRKIADLTVESATNFTAPVAKLEPADLPKPKKTGLEHIFFGIGASSKLWAQRKEYIKLWWKPEMRGIVWLDKRVKISENEKGKLPETRISGRTSGLPYRNKQGHRSAIRISRIVSESLRLLGDTDNVRWFVMGDDDTFFIADNLIRVLNKYDHNEFYYIGSSGESHLQNIYFSYSMAYGGGGFAISYPLAKALEKMQDKCIKRYPRLYGSDDRMQACMAELGVPLTKEVGFHQYDVYGNLFGLLAAHPVAPFVSMHHLDVVEPIFPNKTRVQSLAQLKVPMQLDSAGLMQQSICYVKEKGWTVSVSWGFAVQIIRGEFSPREMEMPSRTFLNWYRRADYTAYSFNTRPFVRNPCQKPYVFYLSEASIVSDTNQTLSKYTQHRVIRPLCNWHMEDPVGIDTVVVFKNANPQLWDKSPRRNCCRVLNTESNKMSIDVGECREGEISEV